MPLEEALERAQSAMLKANYPTMLMPLETSDEDAHGNWTLIYSSFAANKRVRVVVAPSGRVLAMGLIEP